MQVLECENFGLGGILFCGFWVSWEVGFFLDGGYFCNKCGVNVIRFVPAQDWVYSLKNISISLCFVVNLTERTRNEDVW